MGASCDSLTCMGMDQIKSKARYHGARTDDELLRRSSRHQSSPGVVFKKRTVSNPTNRADQPNRIEAIIVRARHLTKLTADAYSILGKEPRPDPIAATIPSDHEPVGFYSTRVLARLYPRRHLRRLHGWEPDQRMAGEQEKTRSQLSGDKSSDHQSC